MLVLGNALGYTLSLLAIFGGIGVLVNVLIVYAVAQVIEEHRDNEQRKRRDRG